MEVLNLNLETKSQVRLGCFPALACQFVVLCLRKTTSQNDASFTATKRTNVLFFGRKGPFEDEKDFRMGWVRVFRILCRPAQTCAPEPG